MPALSTFAATTLTAVAPSEPFSWFFQYNVIIIYALVRILTLMENIIPIAF